MARKRTSANKLLRRRWVHCFEEDTDRGAVFRPDSQEVPLSRRPREVLELKTDGVARVASMGPDDRLVEQTATWRQEGSDIVIHAAAASGRGPRTYRIMQDSADRIIVQM